MPCLSTFCGYRQVNNGRKNEKAHIADQVLGHNDRVGVGDFGKVA